MTDEIRITRRVALPDKYEFYEIQWSTDEPSGKYHEQILEIIENRVADIRKLFGKPSPEISPKLVEDYTGVKQRPPIGTTKPTSIGKKGLSVVMLQEGDTAFTLQGMRIDKIGKRSSGTRNDGTTWERQSMTVSDVTGSLSVVAWGDQTDLFDGFMMNDTVDILKIRELKMYKGKKQAHLGGESEVVKQ